MADMPLNDLYTKVKVIHFDTSQFLTYTYVTDRQTTDGRNIVVLARPLVRSAKNQICTKL